MLPIGLIVTLGALAVGAYAVAIKCGVYGDSDPALFGGTAVGFVAMFTLTLFALFHFLG